MKHIWSILCQGSAIDGDTNVLSLFECLEEIKLTTDKKQLVSKENLIISLKFQLVSMWLVEDVLKDNIFDIRFELFDPSKKSLIEMTNEQTVKKGSSRFRNKVVVSGFPITTEGRYMARLSKKDNPNKEFEIVNEIPVDVKITYKEGVGTATT